MSSLPPRFIVRISFQPSLFLNFFRQAAAALLLSCLSLCCAGTAASASEAQRQNSADVDVLSSASIAQSAMIFPSTRSQSQNTDAVITIAVPDTADLRLERPMVLSTIEKISRAMPETQFRLRIVLTADGSAQLAARNAQARFYVCSGGCRFCVAAGRH